MFSLEIETLARLVIDDARERSLRIVTAESCTGGLVAAALCAIPGASDVFERGFVAYTNRAKQEMLGVSGDLIADLGVRADLSDDGRGRARARPCARVGCDHRRRRSRRWNSDETGRDRAFCYIAGQSVGAPPHGNV